MAGAARRSDERGDDLVPNWVERRFQLWEHRTDVRRELVGGLRTFIVMSYIIAVNPDILTLGGDGLSVRAVATSTCLVAGVLTIAMGLYTNRDIAIAPGLGLNAIVAFTLVGSMDRASRR